MIQAFRRPDCPYISAQFRLQVLESDAVYSVSDCDTGKTKHLTGRELKNDGLTITIPDQPGAALSHTRKLRYKMMRALILICVILVGLASNSLCKPLINKAVGAWLFDEGKGLDVRDGTPHENHGR